jgi:hypothetical protein
MGKPTGFMEIEKIDRDYNLYQIEYQTIKSLLFLYQKKKQ